jgi:transposase-like protein
MKRRRFTREFRLEAVRQLEEGDKPVSEVARELGVPRNRLDRWKVMVGTMAVKPSRGTAGVRSPLLSSSG